jgi:hypothetical protein
MIFRNTIFVRLATATVTAITLLAVFFVPSSKAQFVGTFETNPAVLTALATMASADTVDRAKEDILDGIAWAVAKVAVKSITRSIVTWINSGYQGAPAFSQNLNRDLRQAKDALADAFISDVITGVFDADFIAPVARGAVAAYYLATSDDALAIRLKYTLANFAQDSVSYMRGRNWSSGGLSGWYGLTFRCENDPTCASFITREALYNRLDAQARRYLAEFNAGRGFLSWKGDNCAATNGSQEGDKAFQQCVAQNEAGGEQQDCFLVKESVSTSLKDADTCAAYDVLTPGSVVEGALVEQLGSDVRQLELADSVNEIIGAVVMQMVGQVLGGGGLAGASSPSSASPTTGGGRTPIDRVTDPSTTGSGLTAGFTTTLTTERTNTVKFRTAWADIRAVALEARSLCPVASGVISLVRSGAIEDAIRKADQALARADQALQELDAVLTLLETSSEPDLQQSAPLAKTQRAYELYQNLLSRGVLINPVEQKEATDARSETDPSSLFSTMKNHVDTCN